MRSQQSARSATSSRSCAQSSKAINGQSHKLTPPFLLAVCQPLRVINLDGFVRCLSSGVRQSTCTIVTAAGWPHFAGQPLPCDVAGDGGPALSSSKRAEDGDGQLPSHQSSTRPLTRPSRTARNATTTAAPSVKEGLKRPEGSF